MRLTFYEEVAKREIIFTVRIASTDFFDIDLDPLDMALIDECSKSNKISDKLLMLEMIARKVEATYARKTAPQQTGGSQ